MSTPPRSFRPVRASSAPDARSATGAATPAGLPTPRLWRSRSDRVVAGVLGGLAEKYGLEPRPLRLLYGLLTVVSGGLLAIPYFGIWAITQAHGPARSAPRLWRSRSNKVIAGVLGGLAEKLDVPPTFLRVLFVALSVFSAGFPGLLIYLVLWMITRPMDAPDGGDTY
ncbi:MAG: PspC domain-containing protein [Gemmatimonadota bacterium]|nr:PspC domain-containing protein [Gemmatimonadota bacterium]